LKALKVIHSHKVTHYDIKCDNVLIDFKNDRGGELNLTGRDYSNL
jgi:serine/threonine protein kinase